MTPKNTNLNQEPMEMICVACPKGCRLEIRHEQGKILVSNAGCKRGKEYAVGEINDPRRMVASTVRVNSGLHPLVPVYTEASDHQECTQHRHKCNCKPRFKLKNWFLVKPVLFLYLFVLRSCCRSRVSAGNVVIKMTYLIAIIVYDRPFC